MPAAHAAVVKPTTKASTTARSALVNSQTPVIPAAAVPALNQAPETDTVSLPVEESTPPAETAAEEPVSSPIPTDAAAPTPQTTTVIDLASSPANTLGLGDNLMLAALVAVFALAVIGLVTASGRRGGWRQH